jgi:ABC-type branched-subunit amino acid transport system ATPase component
VFGLFPRLNMKASLKITHRGYVLENGHIELPNS